MEQTAQSKLRGRAFKFGDDISTDAITPGRYLHLRKNLPELAKHAMEDADATFTARVQPGDFVVAGKNFGMGSSREHAPLVLKLNGVAAVIAKSCARIFFRNAINLGLPVLLCDTDRIFDGDTIQVSLSDSVLLDERTGETIETGKLSPAMLRILAEGGVKPFVRKYGGFDALAQDEGAKPQAASRPAHTKSQTLAEKILSPKAGYAVSAGDVIIADVDLAFAHDAGGPLCFREMKDMGLGRIARSDRTAIFLDHAAPSPRMETSEEHSFLREVAAEQGIRVYDIGAGVCHQIILEELAVPGGITLGTDSHTCTAGALCSFGTGMGASDMAVVLGTGKTWLRVPETMEVRLQGHLREWVYPKDAVLELERRLGVDGATYKALEFTGEAVPRLTVSERATIANMVVEMGAKVGLFPSDAQTRAWMAEYGREDRWQAIPLDPGASYEDTIEIDLGSLEPLIACPHQPDNVRPVSEVKGTRIHQVFVGTCTNGRLDDLEVVARILKGRKVHPSTRLIVVPPSRTVLRQAMARGSLLDIVDAGAAVGVPGCGACYGAHMGALANGENALATQNRNFRGRMGNPEGNIYLSSPAVAAATALTGVITDPRELH